MFLAWTQIDVEENGEQDPFVRLNVMSLSSVAETNPALNEGCHPVWNSPIFEFMIKDANADMLKVEVYDSGADDGMPDTTIGDLMLATDTLIRVAESDNPSVVGQWMEDWYPIFQPDGSSCGEIRLEYRFTTEEILMAAEVKEVVNSLRAEPN